MSDDPTFSGLVRVSTEVVFSSPSLVILQIGSLRFTIHETFGSPVECAREVAGELRRAADASPETEGQRT